MGAAARANVVAEFDIDEIVGRWERLYKKLCARHGRIEDKAGA
jgi:hypothetical protein